MKVSLALILALLCRSGELNALPSGGASRDSLQSITGFKGVPWGSSSGTVKDALREMRWTEVSDSVLIGRRNLPFYYHPDRLFYKPEIRFEFDSDGGLTAVEVHGFANTDSILASLTADFGKPHETSELGGRWALWEYKDGSRLIFSSPDTGYYAVPKDSRVIYQSPLAGIAPAGPIVEAPEVVSLVRPKLPGGFEIWGLRELIVVEVDINREGEVHEARIVLQSKYEKLNETALEAARQWVFKPAKWEGEATLFRIYIPFFFQWPYSVPPLSLNPVWARRGLPMR